MAVDSHHFLTPPTVDQPQAAASLLEVAAMENSFSDPETPL